MKIENYIPHIELVLKCFESIKNDYPYLISEAEQLAIEGFISDINKFYEEIKPYYSLKSLTKIQVNIIEKNIKKIFDIEILCKKYIIKIWKDVLTDPSHFSEGSFFDFVVYSFDFDISNFSEEISKKSELVLNYITNRNMGIDNRNYGIIFKLSEDDLIGTSTENIYLDIQNKQDTILTRIFKRNTLKKYIIENKLIFHNYTTLMMTPKMIKQKIIEKEMRDKGTLLGLSGTKEYTNSIIVNSKTVQPIGFFIIIDEKNNYANEIEKLNMYAEVYNVPLIKINKNYYQNILEPVYKRNTI